MLNPTGTGRLVLFETHYGASYNLSHYLVFVLLGIVGGLFGGAFCRLNYLWSKWFRSFALIKNNPVFEVALVVLATTLLQYPNPLTRDPNDVLISNLFIDCRNQTPASSLSYICHRESQPSQRTTYLLLLAAGTLTKLILTIITFGTKVPSGVIIPALAAGALFGRFTSLIIPSALAPPPGLAALVGAAAFLAGVSRMTISLCAIMFELTGELDATLPHMVAILVAKWTADSMGRQSVYDLAQSVLGHPFLDHESALGAVQKLGVRAEELIPPARTMEEITVVVPLSGCVRRSLLEEKRAQLEARGLLDAGLVLVRERKGSEARDLQGYIAQGELGYGLASVLSEGGEDGEVRVLGGVDGEDDGVADISAFVDRTPVSVCAQAPMEYVVEMFGKLGLRYLMLTEEGSGALIGVVIKKVSGLLPACFYTVVALTCDPRDYSNSRFAEVGCLSGWRRGGVASHFFSCRLNPARHALVGIHSSPQECFLWKCGLPRTRSFRMETSSPATRSIKNIWSNKHAETHVLASHPA
jgi:chloride channel 3/4/5